MIEFNFKVGDKVRMDGWVQSYVTITAVGETAFLALDGWGIEYSWRKSSPWLPYVAPPVRRKWLIETVEGPYLRGRQYMTENGSILTAGCTVAEFTVNQIVDRAVEVTE